MAVCNFTSEHHVLKSEYPSDEELANVELFRCLPEELLQFASACCVIFMLIGIPGNLTTIIALARCKKVRNATAIFIINLHISNLSFNCFILPVAAMTFAKMHWSHGWVMCQAYASIKYMLNGSSIFTVLAITINRYVIVCHPLLYPKLYKRRNVLISILMIWTSAIGTFIVPIFGLWGRYNLEPTGGFCTMVPDSNHRSPKKFLLILAFVGPYLTMILCYARIWYVVRTAKKIQSLNPQCARPKHLPLSQTQSDMTTDDNTMSYCPSSPRSFSNTDSDKTPSSDTSAPQSPREDKPLQKYFKAPFRFTRKLVVRRKVPSSRDKRLCAMIVAIMISFGISHLPVMAARLAYKNYHSKPTVNVFAHLLEYSGTWINPIIYVLMSKEYRQAYKSLFETVVNKFQTLKFKWSR
ncbi:hypothetical protein PYW07_012351 [Mythimna separata]|uniref:G-protein coupled receptors family 1 profile domain-containing protein n=1 Tax=Mythimna separata TaxID=271217 RepID=A0AAD7YLZ1_MYTSE|nr:hypothetical protein PYW07_012351 [Mythimna separata]